MAIYQRKIGTPEVYDISEQSPRHISFEEAQKNNIWGQVQDVPEIRTLDGLSGGQSATFERAPQNNSYSIFNNALMEMLKSYQTMGTRPAQEQALDLSIQQAQRGMEQATPGMSPGQQSAVRSASQSALTPSIQGAENRAQTFGEQLSGFKGVLQQTQAMGQALQDQQFKIQENARKMVNDSITQFGSQAFEGVSEQELAQVEKEAGLPKGYLMRTAKTLKERELAQKQQAQEAKYASGSIGEYQFYADQEKSAGRTPMGYNEYQNMDANRKRAVTNINMGNTGLSNQALTQVLKITGQFDGEPIVKKYNQVAEGYAFAKSMSNESNNPADDQALIYSFAKAMDPDSVVREGEYATVQKYSQSWAESFGFNAKRVVENTEFLTPQSRKNIKSSIEKKYKAIESQYTNLYNDYGRRVDMITGQQGTGTSYLADYGAAYPQPTTTGNIQENLDDDIKNIPIGSGEFTTREQLAEALANTPEYANIGLQKIKDRIYELVDDNNQLR